MTTIKARLGMLAGLSVLAALTAPALSGDGESIPLPPPPTTIPFEGCGILEIPNDGSGCVILVTHNGGTYSLEFSGDFEDGDAVCVTGDASYGQCITNCEADSCVFNNTITDQFEGFGTYLQGFECGVFLAEDGAQYQINGPIPDGVEMGSPIFVSGTLDADCLSFCGFVCIQGAQVFPARTEVGTIAPGPQGCPSLNTGSEFLLLENLGGFTFDDRVRVTGAFNQESLLCLPANFPGLEDNTIAAFFEGAGTLAPGPQGCPLLLADDGQSYTFSDTGTFGLGDRVYMTGTIVPESPNCFPVIMQGLEDTTIDPYFEGPGTIGPGPQSCLFFNADSGESFAIDGAGAFGLFDRVYVQGSVHFDTNACFPAIVNEIRNATISAFFEGTGTLGWGPQSCIFLHADSGETFAVDNGPFLPGDRVFMTGRVDPESQACFPVAPLAALEDSTIAGLFEGCGELQAGPQGCLFVGTDAGGFFVVGDTQGAQLLGGVVGLTGVVIPDYEGCFPVSGTALEILDIDSCVAGDANLDGVTDVDDVIAVILFWDTNDHWADVDRSGWVGIDDMVTVIVNWTQ